MKMRFRGLCPALMTLSSKVPLSAFPVSIYVDSSRHCSSFAGVSHLNILYLGTSLVCDPYILFCDHLSNGISIYKDRI